MSTSLRTGIAVATVALGTYLATLCPTIYVGDSGELATVAWSWGIAHPPGYPLWVLLGRLATLLTPGEPALGTNLLSAVCAAGAAGVFAIALVRLDVRPVLAAAAALGFALTPTVWSQALITEVYALHLLLVATLVLAWAIVRSGDDRGIPLAALALGLGIANHPLAALAAVPFFVVAPSRLARRIASSLGLFALGISVYATTFLRGLMEADTRWGAPRDASDIVQHVFRLQYAGETGSGTFGERLRLMLDVWRDDATPLVMLLALVAAGLLARRNRRLLVGVAALLLAAGPGLVLVIGYQDTPTDRSVMRVFFTISILALFALAALGLEELSKMPRLGRRSRTLVLLLVCAAVTVRAGMDWSRSDRRHSTLARDYAASVLGSLPANSRIYALGDSEVFSLAYMHSVRGLRPDVEFVDASLNLFLARYGEDFPSMSRGERRRERVGREVAFALQNPERPIFYTSRIAVETFPGCRLAATGMLYQLIRPAEARSSLPAVLEPMPPVDPHDALESTLAAGIWYRAALSAIEENRREEARTRLARAEEYARELASVQTMLGPVYQQLGDRDGAERCLQRAIELQPDNELALYALATLHRGEAAVPYLERLLALGSADASVRLLLAVERVRTGRIDEARRLTREARAIDPNFLPTRELLEALEADSGSGPSDPVEVQRKVEGLALRWRTEVARAQLREGNLERAIATLTDLVQRYPQDISMLRSLGYALLQGGHLDEATDTFRKLVEAAPENADAANALAYVLAITGSDLDSAGELAQRAMDSSAELRPYAMDTLGWIQFRAGDFDAALETLRDAARTLPPDDSAMRAENAYHQAWVLHELGRLDEARAAVQRGREGMDGQFWRPDLEALELQIAGTGTRPDQ